MTFHNMYLRQVELLLDVLPIIRDYDCFALKGGTAINLFIRDMPRLSIDIDLQYLPIEPRDTFITNINKQLSSLMQKIQQTLKIKTMRNQTRGTPFTKINVMRDDVIIKIEPNFIMRGCIYPASEQTISQVVQDHFLRQVSLQVLSHADLYGSKIVAALDRQHPRDLFDIKLLFDHEGITEDIRKSFLTYLICSPRPMHELLAPNLYDISKEFTQEFSGMVADNISLDLLISTRQRLINDIVDHMNDNDKNFLLSVKRATPDFSLLGIPHIADLPAVKWKILNIKKMNRDKQREQYLKLESILN